MGWMAMIYLLGVLSTVLLYMLPWSRWLKREPKAQQSDIGDERRALTLLLMHREKADVQGMIEKLEARLYGGREVMIDRKELKRVLKRYQG